MEKPFGRGGDAASVAPARRAARISAPSDSARQARRLSAWLGRRDSSSHRLVARWPTKASSLRFGPQVTMATPLFKMEMNSWSASPTLFRERRSMLSTISADPRDTRPVRIASKNSPSAPTFAFVPRKADTPRSFSERVSSSTQPFSRHISTANSDWRRNAPFLLFLG